MNEYLVSKIEYYVKEILKLLGEDIERPGIRETPRRVAQTLLELTRGLREEEPQVKFFPITYKVENSLIIVEDIRFHSLCEHHLLPIIGSVSIAYIPEGLEVPGLSKIARLVEWYSSRLILQERFTQELTHYLFRKLNARFIYCKVCAVHLCTLIRGVKNESMKLVTEYWYGDTTNVNLDEVRKSVKCRINLK